MIHLNSQYNIIHDTIAISFYFRSETLMLDFFPGEQSCDLPP